MHFRVLFLIPIILAFMRWPCLAENARKVEGDDIYHNPAVAAFRVEVTAKSRPLLGGLGKSDGPLGYITEFFFLEDSPPLFSIGGDAQSDFKNNIAYIVPTPMVHKWFGGAAYKVCTAPSTLFGTCYPCDDCALKEKNWQKHSLPIMDDWN